MKINSDRFSRSKVLFEKITYLYKTHTASVGLLMSGKGTNAENILEKRHLYPNLVFKAIITDQPQSNALFLSKKFGLEYICLERKIKGKEEREKYFEELISLLKKASINTIIYAGFMKIVTDKFLEEFPGINSHPADLTVLNEKGYPRYVGMDVVMETIQDNNTTSCCTTCIVDNPADHGMPIALSNDVLIKKEDKNCPTDLHNRMKQEAEWKYYPLVIQMLYENKLNLLNIPYKFTSKDYL
jgi:phosphoribosylglycinamide formyltransferase-1